MKVTVLSPRKAQFFNPILLSVLIFSGWTIQAQSGSTPLALAPGTPAGSYQLSDIDSINLFNGHVSVRMPVLTAAGRGGAAGQMTFNWGGPATYHVRSDVDPNNGSQINYVEPGGGGAFSLDGISLGFVQVYGIQAGSPVSTHCWMGDYYTYQKTLTRLYFVEPDGTEHEMRDVQTGGQPLSVSACALNGSSRGKIFVSTDGSGATFIADTPIIDYIYAGGDFPYINPAGYLLLSNGTRYRVNDSLDAVMRDRNGNLLTQTYVMNPPIYQYEIKDSLNRKIIRNTGACPPPFSGTCPILSYKGYNGSSRGVSFAGSNPIQMILPNGRTYKFYLNEYNDLTRIDLPTGGSIEYDYGPGIDGPQPDVGYWIQNSMPGTYMIGLGVGVVYRRVTERKVYKEGHVLENRQTFSKPEYFDGSNPNPLNLGYVDKKQYAADGSLLFTERHFFYGAATNSFYVNSIEYSPWKEGREYHSEFYDQNGNLARQTNLTWEQRATVPWWSGSADATPQMDPRVSQSSTVLENGLTSTTINGYDPTVSYNSLTDVYQYDFGGALLRHVQTNFVKTLNGTDYTGTNIQNPNSPYMRELPSQVSVFDAAGERSRTSFEYDNYADTNHAALVARSGISGLDSFFTTSYTYRGNPTGITRYLLTGGVVTGSVSTYTQYDVAGNVVKAIDARGNALTLQYSDSYGGPNGEARTNSAPTELSSLGQSSFAFPTSVTNALNQTTYNQFDYYLGQAVDAEDLNGVVSSGAFDDPLDRPTQIILAANQSTAIKNQTSYSYDDGSRIVTVTADRSSYNDPNPLKTQTVYGSFGEVIETRQYEGGSNYIATQIQYDNLGRPFKRSNPFRPWQSGTPVWTMTAFDALGRTISVTTPDNAAVTTSYSGNSMTVTDPANKARKSVTDSLGRLIEVYEDPAGLNYQTSYRYDGLDNLVRVTQGSQQRFFMYDSLKRLIRADNPEQETLSTLNLTDPVTGHSNWTAKYEYDNNGNLTFKTDARGVVTENRYDALNRLDTVLYRINGQPDPNTGDIQYVYDNATYGKGRLWLTYRWGAKPSHTTVGEYDAMGRVKQLWNDFSDGQGGWLPGYGISRNYNLAGQVTSQTYPSGRTVNYSYDTAGRTTGFTGNLGDGLTRSYASSFVYNARSQVTQELFGTQTPLYHKLQYNVRGQLWDVRVSTNNDGSSNRGGLQFFYDGSLGYGTSGPDNNGNVLFANTYSPEDQNDVHWAITRQRYNYDSLNRLKSVTEYFVNYNHPESPQSVQTYDYDRWGNRTIKTGETWGTGINNTAFDIETARNRLYSPGDLALTDSQRRIRYDQAGNQVKDTYTGYGTATYDGDNHIVAIQDKFGGSSTYTYNANGQRVRRKINNQETWDIYGIDGELVAEYAANGAVGAPQKEYGYRDGQLLITAASGSGTSSSGLVGHWKLDENSGTTAADASGNNNPGTLSAGATWTTGQSGAATNLDGVDDYVQVGAQSSLALTNAGTLSAWIYPTGAGSLATFGGIIINKEGEYELARFQDGTIQCAFANTNPGWGWINTGYVAPLNQWTHVAVTYDNGVVKTYINGTLFHTYSGSGAIGDFYTSQNDFRIGGRQFQSHNFQGRIDEVRVYNRALSASEVTSLQPAPASGLKGNWKFDENSGTTTADSSGNNNTGTLTSGATWTTGQSGAATNLDGVNDYVQVGAQSSLALASAGTLSAWIYPTGAGSLATYGGIIINKEGEYEVARFQDGTIQWAFANTNPGWTWINTGYVAPLNQWTHVAVTYDSGVVKTYINGTLFHTYSGSGAIGDVDSSQNDFRIGGRQSTSHNFQGRIDEVRVYNRALSATEVTTLPSGSSSSSAQINWLVPDHLGTPRIILDQTGSFANVRRHDYLPFGEELSAGAGGRTPAMGYAPGDIVRQQFTQKERDSETGLDYFGARYFASVQGRFTSHDPLLQSGRMTIPQSWNRYTYVLNNPLRLIDPNGLADSDVNEEEQKRLEQQQKEQQQETQVVDLRKDKLITAEVAKIQANAKPLAADEAPVLSDVRPVIGETVSVNNGTVINGYGEEATNFTGVVRPVAYIPLDQRGNIIDGNGVAILEAVKLVSGVMPETSKKPAPTPKGGVFIDVQLLAAGQPTTSIEQGVFLGQFSRSGGQPTTMFKTTPNAITKNADARTVSVKLGPTQKVW